MTQCARPSCSNNTNNKYCSTSCSNKDRAAPEVKKENNPNWSGGKETFTCPVCDEKFERYKSTVRDNATPICSNECNGEWHQKINSGTNNPLWKGGSGFTDAIRQNIGDESWQLKSKNVRQGESCKKCGAAENLVVHHIVPIRAGGTNDRYNLMVLCKKCHREVENFTNEIIHYGIY